MLLNTRAGGYGAHHHHHPHHMGAPAKQLLSAQFMPEGLRQQLQQSNSLIQVQVSNSLIQVQVSNSLIQLQQSNSLIQVQVSNSLIQVQVSSGWHTQTSRSCTSATVSSSSWHRAMGGPMTGLGQGRALPSCLLSRLYC
jgi:hypothetical protein